MTGKGEEKKGNGRNGTRQGVVQVTAQKGENCGFFSREVEGNRI